MTYKHIGLVGISNLADNCDLVKLVYNYYPVDLNLAQTNKEMKNQSKANMWVII